MKRMCVTLIGVLFFTGCATAKSTDNVAARQTYFEQQTMENLRRLQKGVQSLAGTTGTITQRVDALGTKQTETETKLNDLTNKQAAAEAKADNSAKRFEEFREMVLMSQPKPPFKPMALPFVDETQPKDETVEL